MSPLESMKERRAAKKAELDALLALPTDEKRDLTTDEATSFDTLVAEVRKYDERISELEAQEARSAAAAAHRVETGATGEQRTEVAQVTEKPIYQQGDRSTSYFRDLAKSQLFADVPSMERLRRHARGVELESRALGNTNTTGGSGGEFAPPQWLVDQFVKLPRAGRVTADLYNKMDVPVGVSNVNLPKILTGTSVALQSTQNTALSQTDLTTGYVSTGFSTVGGKQVVSQQLLDQSAIDFDTVIMSDLAASYTTQLGSQVVNGTGTGSNNNSVVNGLLNATVPAANQITFTQASPTAAQFYSKAAGALAAFSSSRFEDPTVWLMHPRRWFWLLAQADSNGRPLVVPLASVENSNVLAHNAMGAATAGGAKVQGLVGLFLGLPVYIDPNLPTNLGAGTNQDRVYLLKQDDLWLMESAPRMEVFRETYADSVGVLFRLYSYVGTILNRITSSIAYIDGTGLVAPTF
ncbi:MAG: phage major capsid protein [Blastococcus sp.]